MIRPINPFLTMLYKENPKYNRFQEITVINRWYYIVERLSLCCCFKHNKFILYNVKSNIGCKKCCFLLFFFLYQCPFRKNLRQCQRLKGSLNKSSPALAFEASPFIIFLVTQNKGYTVYVKQTQKYSSVCSDFIFANYITQYFFHQLVLIPISKNKHISVNFVLTL